MRRFWMSWTVAMRGLDSWSLLPCIVVFFPAFCFSPNYELRRCVCGYALWSCGAFVFSFFTHYWLYMVHPTWSHSHLVASWARWCASITAGQDNFGFCFSTHLEFKIYLNTVYFVENWKFIVENTVTKYFLLLKILLTRFSSLSWSMNSTMGPAKKNTMHANAEMLLCKCTLIYLFWVKKI